MTRFDKSPLDLVLSYCRERLCNCGSGLASHDVNDARGIYICRACDKCRSKKLAGYRPEVLTDSNYEHDEPIEEEL